MIIESHLEKMDHEIKDVSILLDKFAYKVDGVNGIKDRCGLNSLKSVDYIEVVNNEVYYIEFSDVESQLVMMLNESKEFRRIKLLIQKEGNLNRKMIESVYEYYHKKAFNEMLQKFKDTKLIINIIGNKYKDDVSRFNEKPHPFLVMIRTTIDGENKSEVARLMNTLKDKLRVGLPENLFCTFKIIYIDDYANGVV